MFSYNRVCSLTTECVLLLYRMCSLTTECVLLHVVVADTVIFSVKILCYGHYRMCSRTLECGLLLQNVFSYYRTFSYYRMYPLTTECVLLHVVVEDTVNFSVKIL